MIDAPAAWGGQDDQPAQPNFTWKRLSEYERKSVTFLEYPFIQASTFHLLAGIKNSGKGTYLSTIAARTTLGYYTNGSPRGVLWLSLNEDSYSYDVRPRVEAAGGDPSGVVTLDGYGFKLPDHVEHLTTQIRSNDAGLVIIDPLGGATTGETNSDWNVRPALACLNVLADETGAAVFGVRHISNKAGKRGDGVLSGVLGSSDWVNVPRALLALIHDDIDPMMRHLFLITGNRTPLDLPGQMLAVESIPVEGEDQEIPKMRVVGESHKDPDELLTVKRTRQTSRSDTGRAILLQVLNEQPGGEMESDTLDAEVARRSGLAARTVRDLRMEMNKRGLTRARPEKDTAGGVVSWHAVLTNAGAAIADADANGAPPLQTPTPLATPLSPTSPTTTSRESVTRDSGDSGDSGSLRLWGNAGKNGANPESREYKREHGTLGGLGEVSSPESRDARDHAILGDPGDSGLPTDAPEWERRYHEQRGGGA